MGSLKGPRLGEGVVIIGHRGSRGTHSENTLGAFQEAVDAGAAALELDVHFSLEVEPYVYHDPEINRRLCRDPDGKVVQNPKPIRELRNSEIELYDCGNNYQIAFPDQKRVGKTSIPTLARFLQWAHEAAPNVYLLIEIKTTIGPGEKGTGIPADTYARKVLRDLQEHEALGHTIIQSSDLEVVRLSRKFAPEIPLSAVVRDPKDFDRIAIENDLPYVTPEHVLLTRDRVARCQDHGIQIFTWTLNQEKHWDKAIELGVDGIITDYPRKLAAYLNR